MRDDEVHLWRVFLESATPFIFALQGTLSIDEQVRAQRFYFRKDWENFVIARGVLRDILGHYESRNPDQLRFCYNPYGKPFLADEFCGEDLRFNVSHSGGIVLYAITRGRDIGVDLEHKRSELADEQIAERFFSTREATTLRALPKNLQREAFFNCWTRKEAYIKARGEGLSFPLDRFEVSLVPGEPAALLKTKDDPDEASRWSLHNVNPGSGYIAAVAVARHNWKLKCWQWSGAISDHKSRDFLDKKEYTQL